MKKMNNENQGITLIALIITIIVMLILSGVVLNLFLNENGIINYAKYSKDLTLMQNALEKVKLAVLDSYSVDGKILYGNMENVNSVENNINKIEGIYQKITNNITEFPIIVIVDGYKIQIKENGDVELVSSNTNSYEKEKSSLVLLEHFEKNYSNKENDQIDINKLDINNKKFGNASLSLDMTAVINNDIEQFNFTKDFTIDYWINLSSENLNSTWAPMLVVGEVNGIWIGLNNGKFVVRGYATQDYIQLEPPKTGEWTHIAICRENGMLYVFYDGTLQGEVENTTNFTKGRLVIGSDGAGSYLSKGYMDELRIINGIAKWNSNFTTTNTEYKEEGILYHFNYNRVSVDTATIDTTEKKFGNSSKYFNKTYMIYDEKQQDKYNFTEDFTIDYWINLSSENLNSTWAPMLVVGEVNGIWIGLNNGKFVVRGYATQECIRLEPPKTGKWTHIAICRENGILYVFYDGTLQGKIENTTNFAKGKLIIGYDGTESYLSKSYIDELRILNGYCCWSKNYEVPEKEYQY